MDWSSTLGLWSGLEWRGFMVTALITLGWLLIIRWALCSRAEEDDLRVPLLWIPLAASFVLGAIAFAPSISAVQVPLQTAVSRWVMANLRTANTLILSAPAVAISGLIQEPVKVLIALAILQLGRAVVRGRRAAVSVGVLVGAGYGAMEAWIVASSVFLYPEITLATALPALSERAAVVVFHAVLTGVVLHQAWGKGVKHLVLWTVLVSVYHVLLNASVPFFRAGLLTYPWVLAYIWMASMAGLAYLVWILKREG